MASVKWDEMKSQLEKFAGVKHKKVEQVLWA